MNRVYRVAGISKQGFHQRLDRMLGKLELKAQLLPLLVHVRKDHPEMSARSIYHLLRPKGIGREQFIQWAYDEGFKLVKKKRLRLTTDSTGTQRFPNRIAGREFTGINQAWVSDITYYPIGDRSYYLTLIAHGIEDRMLISKTHKRLTVILSASIGVKDRAIYRIDSSLLDGLHQRR